MVQLLYSWRAPVSFFVLGNGLKASTIYSGKCIKMHAAMQFCIQMYTPTTVRYNVLTVVLMEVQVFWNVTSC
jgi:hypothetical protein